MPIAPGPATPPSTVPTSPISPTGTDDFIDCEKGAIDDEEEEEEDEEIIEECNEKGSQDNIPNIPSRHREKDGRLKLVQRSERLSHTPMYTHMWDQILNCPP